MALDGHESHNSALGTCSYAPPQLCPLLRMCSFGFNARYIRGTMTTCLSLFTLAKPLAGKERYFDRERFTHARRSCMEPDRSVGKVPPRRTVSLFRRRVPKPLRTSVRY